MPASNDCRQVLLLQSYIILWEYIFVSVGNAHISYIHTLKIHIDTHVYVYANKHLNIDTQVCVCICM